MRKTQILLIIILLFKSIFLINAHNKPLNIKGDYTRGQFEFLDNNNNPSGFSVDVIKAIMEELGKDYTINLGLIVDNVNELNDNETDIITCVSYSQNYSDSIFFSDLYMTTDYVCITKDDDFTFDMKSLSGRKIAVSTHTFAYSFFKNIQENILFQLITTVNQYNSIELILNDQVDIAICHRLLVNSFIYHNKITNLHIYDTNLPNTGLRFASKSKDLISEMNSAMNNLKNDGSFDIIKQKWSVKERNDKIAKLFFIIILISILLVLLAVLIYVIYKIRLKKAIEEVVKAKNSIVSLLKSIRMLLENSEIDIYLHELQSSNVQILKSNGFAETDIKLDDRMKNIHPEDEHIYSYNLNNILSGEVESASYCVRIFDEDTSDYNYYSIVLNGIKDKTGKVTKILFSRKDETLQRKKIVDQKETIESLDLALQSGNLHAWNYDIKNKKIHIMQGFSNYKNIGLKEFLIMVADSDRMRFINSILNRSVSENTIIANINYKNDDTFSPCEITVSVSKDSHGNAVALYGIQKDITEKHNFENKIKEQLELLETLKNNMPVGMNFYDRNGILQDTNNYQRKLVGMKSDFKGIGKINALKLDFAVDSVIESLENSSTSSYIVTHKELSRELNEYLDDSQPHGEVFDVKCSPLFDGEESFKGYISIYNDITELYNSRKEILDLKNKLALALKAGDMEAWIYDTKKLIFTSIQGENLIDGDEISLDQLIEITHRDDVIILKECLYRLTNKISVLETAIFRINKENQWRWFKYNISKIDEENDTLRFAGIRKDVTEEIETKSQLEKSNLKLIESNSEISRSEAKLRKILDKLPIPIYIKDPILQKQTYANEEAIKTFGASILEDNFNHLIFEDIEMQKKIDMEIINTDKEYITNETLRFKNGNYMETYLIKSPVNINGSISILAVRIDLTSKIKAQLNSKILSISLPSLNATIWYYDSLSKKIHYGSESYVTSYSKAGTLESFALFIHPDDREYFLSGFNELLGLDSGEKIFHYRLINEDTGLYEWWECRTYLELNNNMKYVYGIDININKQKHDELYLRNSRRELKSLYRQNDLILNNIASGLIFVDTNLIVQWSNVKKAVPFVKEYYKTGEVCYKTFGYNEPCTRCPISKSIKDKCMVITEFDAGKDGYYESISIPVENDEGLIEGYVIRIDNITERHKLINELKEAKEAAVKSDKLKSVFLANMSHEIRTPLNAIVGFSGLLLDVDDPAEKEEYVKLINANNQMLIRLVNDILDLSKIESGTIDIHTERFDFVDMFNYVIAINKNKFDNNKIRMLDYNIYERCYVSLDKNRVIQIFTNFISNACKYTESGFVYIGFESANDGIKIFVKDTGIGISIDKQSKIFSRFGKIDESSQGTGLGLAISKAITETMGGKIGFESEENKGSTFWAWFPTQTEIVLKHGIKKPDGLKNLTGNIIESK